MEQRHRKESKELQGRITQLKKSIGKGAATKQKKKEIQDQIAQMELDLTKRHEEEKQNFTLENGISSIELEDPVTLDSVTPDSVTLPETLNETGKKNKAKKRKERKMEELEEERKRAGEEALHLTNHKEIEQRAIDEILLSLNLKINEIPADGHCLYNSISHQLLVLSGKEYSYRDLRRLAAQYIKSNANDFLPFLIDDSAGFEKYVNDCEHGAVWGGQFEIQALSQSLQRQIQIIQANSPMLTIGEEFQGEPIRISYHRHAFGLGEHYNSLTQ